MKTVSVLALSLIFLCASSESAAGADRLVLRDLTIIADKTVSSFDEDGVKLDNGSLITWDNIEKGTVAEGKQAAFDRFLASLGGDLYRLRQRLSVGDDAGLAGPVAALYPRYKDRSSETAYMVCQAAMWSALASGKREAALGPYLRCFAYIRSLQGKQESLPGSRRLSLDLSSGLSDDLAPIFFDATAAQAELPEALEAIRTLGGSRPPATYIYYAALALAAGDDEKAMQSLQALKDPSGLLAELRDVLLAQREATAALLAQREVTAASLAQREAASATPGEIGPATSALENRLPLLNAKSKPLALYWIGVQKARSADPAQRQDGMLSLLRIPALYGADFPELAGASLYESMLAMAAANDAAGRAALSRELLKSYSSSYHAGLVQAASRK